jgi:hypothetical protein
MEPFAPYQMELVKIADRLASQGSDQSEAAYLRRFRIIYRHLAASVSSVGIETGMAAFGMGPGFPQPNSADIIAKTDEELSELA